MEYFAIIVNGFQPLTIITKRSILDVAAVLDPPLFKSGIHVMVLMIESVPGKPANFNPLVAGVH